MSWQLARRRQGRVEVALGPVVGRLLAHRRPSDTLAALAALDLFRGSPRTDLDRLARDADLIDVASGDVIDVAGSRARQLIGVVAGQVWAVSADGDRAVLGPGEQFGAAELLAGYPHARTYVAAAPARIVVVFGPAFCAVADTRPPMPSHPRALSGPITEPLVSASAY
ncbi:MAG TPA: cyclic nucleotide-binding domain-containing protein [Ilumatobacter sp.]|nr:cyclic nucleotide-binding domain-containing protein [Ilumatobacter sp.]